MKKDGDIGVLHNSMLEGICFISDGAKMVDPKGKEETLKFTSKGHFRLLKLVVDVANLQLHSCND